MTNSSKRAALAVVASLGLTGLAASGESELRFKVKYELEIGVPPELRSIESRTYVPDGSVISIELGQYDAAIKITGTSPGYYEVEVLIINGADDSETAENVATVTFSGEDGVPAWFEWNTAEIHIRMRLVASGDRR